MEPDMRKGEASREPLDPQLHAWLDGELDGEEREAVKKRLASDAEARGQLDLFERCEEWLATSSPAAPPGLPERIQRALRDERRSGAHGVAAAQRGRKAAGWLWITGFSAAAAAALFLLWMAGPRGKSVEEPTRQWAMSSPSGTVDQGTVGHEFVLDAPGAKQVCLVGDFNGWEVCRTPMSELDQGLWKIRLDLPPGRHEYMFVVDGRWVTDPRAALRIDDGFGSQNAVVLL